MNHSEFYRKTIDCSHSIATNRTVSIPNDRFEYWQSKGSRVFPPPSVTDKLPPDAPILLRHTPSRGRFNGRCSSGILTVLNQEGNILSNYCSTYDFLLDFPKFIITATIFRTSPHECETSRASAYDVTLAEFRRPFIAPAGGGGGDGIPSNRLWKQ
jgi:hypothetical protein